MVDKADLSFSDGGMEERLIEENDSDYLNENARRRMLYTNFILMSVAFSLNHGCVVSCLAYASSELGDTLGAYGGGFLYIAYSFSALALAQPVVEAVGPKLGLFAGVLGYCIYVMGFMLSVVFRESAWGIFIIASIVGGLSGGILWTAQGKYFASNAILYADAVDKPVEQVNAQFAGIFAAIYLGCEMVAGLIASGVYFGMDDNANAVVFSIYTMVAIVSVLVMLAISNLDEYGQWEMDYEDIIANATSTIRLLRADTRLLLMVPYQVAFGFVSTFVPYYIFGTVVSDADNLGEEYVGVLAAMAVFAGAAIALPAAEVAVWRGKEPVMVFGGLCMAMVGMILVFARDKALSRWRVIIPYLLIYGTGRGVWVSKLLGVSDRDCPRLLLFGPCFNAAPVANHTPFRSHVTDPSYTYLLYVGKHEQGGNRGPVRARRGPRHLRICGGCVHLGGVR
jgi:hypothetical protein